MFIYGGRSDLSWKNVFKSKNGKVCDGLNCKPYLCFQIYPYSSSYIYFSSEFHCIVHSWLIRLMFASFFDIVRCADVLNLLQLKYETRIELYKLL